MFTVTIGIYLTSVLLQEHAHEKGADKAELRIYLADREKKPVDLSDVTASVLLEPKGAPRQVLKTELVRPKAERQAAFGRGGEAVEMDGYWVEVVIHAPHAGHDKGHAEHKEEDSTPYFRTPVELSAYSCGMQGHPVLEKPGTCPKCPMQLKPAAREFGAVVIFKIKGETKNAKGFQYPPAVPATYKDAVSKIEEHLKAIEGLVASGELPRVHGVAEKISRICEKLAGLAPKETQASVAKVAKEVVALFGPIDDAADNGRKEDTLKVLETYRSKVQELKKHVHAGGDLEHKEK